MTCNVNCFCLNDVMSGNGLQRACKRIERVDLRCVDRQLLCVTSSPTNVSYGRGPVPRRACLTPLEDDVQSW